MTFVLRKPVQVFGDGAQASTPLKTLAKGTALDAIASSERAQLAPEHFIDATVVDGRVRLASDELPSADSVGQLARDMAVWAEWNASCEQAAAAKGLILWGMADNGQGGLHIWVKDDEDAQPRLLDDGEKL